MVSKAPEPLILRFDSFAADLHTCELRKGDRPVKLQPQPFKLLVLLASRPGELVTREEIRKELWSDDTFVDFEHGINYSIQQIRNALGESANKPRFVQTVPRRGYRFITAVEVEGAQPVSQAGTDLGNPYPGLAAFTESDSDCFFGREEEIKVLKGKLERRSLLALIGASGAGKTSLLRAGLIPSLPGSWSWVWCEPGTSPLQNLARSLVPQFLGDAETTQKLVSLENVEQALAVLYLWRERQEEVLLIVDQFEELFTLNGPEEQSRFAELLGRAASETGIRVLVSLRDDFLLLCNDHEPLAPVFESLTPLTPPQEPALLRILTEPARKQGYAFEDGELVNSMLSEVKGERGALPLLAFAAARMWIQRDRETKHLTWDAYREIEGVGGALAQHAEAVLERICAEQHDTVREIFRNLITAQGTRIGRSREELLSVFEDRGRAGAVVQALVNARLLTTFETAGPRDQELSQQIEIIHESLLKNWPRLVGWQTQDADSARVRDQLRQTAQVWEERGRSSELLWTGTAVKEFQVWRERYSGGLTATEESFSQAMVWQAGHRRRKRRMVVISVIALLLGGLTVITTLWQRSVAETRRAEASKLLALGQLELERFPTLAVSHALKSLELSDTLQGRLFALQALQQGPTAIIMRSPEGFEEIGWAHEVCFSPDGSRLAIGGYNTVHVQPWNGETPQLICKYPTAGFQVVESAFSPSGERLVTVKNSEMRLWSVPDFNELGGINNDDGPSSLFKTHNGFYSATKLNNEVSLRKWSFDGTDSQVVGRMELRLQMADIDCRGRWLAYGKGKRVFLRSLNDWGRQPRLIGEHPDNILDVTFHPDGSRSASIDDSGEIRLWSVDSESEEPVGILRGDGLEEIRFDSSGSRLATYGNVDGRPTVRLWNLKGPVDADATVLKYQELPPPGFLNGAAFDADGRWLATANAFSVALWPLGDRFPITLAGHEGRIDSVVFTPDGEHLVSAAGGDDTVRLWSLESGASNQVILKEDLQFPNLAMDPAGKFVVVPVSSSVFVVPLGGGASRKLEGFSSASINLQIALDRSGRFVAATAPRGPAKEKVIRIWDLQSGKSWALGPLDNAGDGYQGSLGNLVFLPDGRLLSGGPSGLELWSLEEGHVKTLSRDPGHTVVSHDGRYALRSQALGEDVGTFRHIWFDLEKEASKVLSSYGNVRGRPVFDPSDRIVVSAGFDGVVRVGPVAGEEPHLLFSHEGTTHSVTASPDGRSIASAGSDGKIRLWPMPDIDKPPFHTLPYEELLTRLRNVTNLRVVEDEGSSTGYSVDFAPFPGWKRVPEW